MAIDRIVRGPASFRFTQCLQQSSMSGDEETQQLVPRLLYDPANATDPAVAAVLQAQTVAPVVLTVSVVYWSGTSSSDSLERLDLIVPSLTDYEALYSALEDLVSLSRQEQLFYTRSLQWLQYQWSSNDLLNKQNWNDTIDEGEWITFCEHTLCLPSRRRAEYANWFREWCHENNKTTYIYLEEVGMLLERVPKLLSTSEPNQQLPDDPIDALWQQLVATDPQPESRPNEEASISSRSFLAFLQQTQRESQIDLQHVQDLITVLQEQVTPTEWWQQSMDDTQSKRGDDSSIRPRQPSGRADQRLSRSRFYAYLHSDANDAMHHGKPTDDMTQPLSHYWIASSHDSYLQAILPPGSSSSSASFVVTEQAYTNLLLRGIRCLEVAVWDGLTTNHSNNHHFNDPVVIAHDNPRRKKGQGPSDIPAHPCIPAVWVWRTIRRFLEANPYTFPIILRLENHIVSERNAQKLTIDLDAVLKEYLLIPKQDNVTASVTLPSPESARGKVILLAKRPLPGVKTVIHDDYDRNNTTYDPEPVLPTRRMRTDDPTQGPIVGFDEFGPVREARPSHIPSPSELYQAARTEADHADERLRQAEQEEEKLRQVAHEQENKAAQLTLQAGLSPTAVKQRAAAVPGSPLYAMAAASSIASSNGGSFSPSMGTQSFSNGDAISARSLTMRSTGSFLDKTTIEEEGVEVHEFLPQTMSGDRDIYETVALQAHEASEMTSSCAGRLRAAQQRYEEAQQELRESQSYELQLADQARRATNDARSHKEDALQAQERVKQVRELLLNSQDNSNSAGTVVQTALTEAKISEKRATDAEARASRAASAAEKERARCDEETRKEERMEQEVGDLHDRCEEARDRSKHTRERVEKATALLERVNEQIRQIENSSQYRQEHLDGRSNGQMRTKRAEKIEEQARCRALIKEATEELAASESHTKLLQSQFEDKARSWRIQAEMTAQIRRTADRSAHMADELAEHADEEREAARLRQAACERAEAAVQDRGSQQSSIEAQLAEAERAAAESAKTAVQCRHRAEKLSREAEAAKDHSAAERLVETRKWEYLKAKGEFDAANAEQEKRDKVLKVEERRLAATSDIVEQAERDVKTRTTAAAKIRVDGLYEDAAVEAFNLALTMREAASAATERTQDAALAANTKRFVARSARDYKEREEMSIAIPDKLAAFSYLHSTRFRHWSASQSLSNVHLHSIEQDVLLEMLKANPGEERRQFHDFTKNHLCRIFPNPRKVPSNDVDPVLPWSLGCQLVAMNVHADGMTVADGRFRKNGGCGYVLKPRALLRNDAKLIHPEQWTLHILSGSYLLSPWTSNTSKNRSMPISVNPRVEVKLFTGSLSSPAATIHETEVVRGNGVHPVWPQNKVAFSVESPTTEILLFTVWNDKESLGSAAIPVDCLQEGYRSVALFDRNNARDGPNAHSSILVFLSKE